jgi:hypothetical protein
VVVAAAEVVVSDKFGPFLDGLHAGTHIEETLGFLLAAG